MNGMIAWFARHGVAANLLMVAILVGGGLTITNLRQEVFPEFSADRINITVPYPGAAPAEVEEAICVRIEEKIQDLEGIQRLTSTASENVGVVSVELEPETDARAMLNDIKTRVDSIDTFPEEAEKPLIEELILRRQVINVAVTGDTDEAGLKAVGERIRDELSSLPGITQVSLAAARPYEISIEVSEEALRRYSLTFDDVALAVRRSSLELPGGSIKTEGGEILLRTAGQAERGLEFEELTLLTRPDGTRVRLADVATVVDGFADTEQAARFDGEPAVLVQVFRVGDQNALEIADAVKNYVQEAGERLAPGITLTTWQDDTQVLRSRLDLMLRNGRTGLILVFLVLALFLRLKLAVWVAAGIPISFMGAILLMPTMDVSVNLISLFAFIVVLGIVVDDAIVVGENIFRRHQQGAEGLEAAVRGAQEMAVPVCFAILTTLAAFAPLLTVEGNTGKVMKVIPLIVIATLAFSLIESLLVLPAHLSHLYHSKKGEEEGGNPLSRLWYRFQRRFARGLEVAAQKVYRPTLDRALEWRYLAVAVAVALLAITIGLVAGGRLRFTFFPPVEAENVVTFLTMPQGTPAEQTSAAVRRIEESAIALQRQIEEESGEKVFRHILTSIGEQPFRTAQAQGGGGIAEGFSGSNLGEVNIELTPSEERSITSPEIATRWRELAGATPDAVEQVTTASLFSTGEAINVQFVGQDIETLRQLADGLKERLREYPGVFDITDSFRAGKQEVQLQITPEAEALGLRLGDLARQVRQAFFGEEAQRLQRGRDEVKVMVRYPEEERRSLADLESMRVRIPGGVEVPFSTAATAEYGRGFSTIRRSDRSRIVNVTADVDPVRANATEIVGELRDVVLPELLAGFPGTRYTFEGTQEQQRQTINGLKRGFGVALLVIYALLAIPFRSYFQPLIVMSAIPFGFIGAVWGHVFMGIDLTILSGFGLVALTGVVVNDSLVMVDFINRRVRSGMGTKDAIRVAGEARFRPIVLTSLTTFAGLTPLLLEKSLQAQFLIPMAVSLAFGILFATVIILLLVPVLYRILEDLKALIAGSSREEVGEDGSAEDDETDDTLPAEPEWVLD